ncbi:MAG: hypothetical protein ITD33_04145 [Nitrosarchaeum sp.]|nr:hypothetical protein [Nitrosarchaeum sp.]MBP0120032.1 hypothetical protein [Nitrosarchaeum sp.]MBP0134476.1 hypothetical protein [Nitrosarchaeum sp.]
MESIVYFIILNIQSDIGYIGELFEVPLLGKSITSQCIEYEMMLKNIQENFD